MPTTSSFDLPAKPDTALLRARTKAGLTQPQLAELANVSIGTIVRIEGSIDAWKTTQYIILLKLARALKTVPEELMGEEN